MEKLPRFLEYKRLRQQAILGHAFFHPPFSKNILIWSKMTYYEGGKNNFSPSGAIWGLQSGFLGVEIEFPLSGPTFYNESWPYQFSDHFFIN